MCEYKLDIANESYHLVDSHIKKLNELIEYLNKEIINTRHLEVNNNILVNKQYEEIINFENFLNSIY